MKTGLTATLIFGLVVILSGCGSSDADIRRVANESVATVSCNSEFIAPAANGDLILGRGEVTRRGGSMVFVRCELLVGETVILTSSAVIKRLRKKS